MTKRGWLMLALIVTMIGLGFVALFVLCVRADAAREDGDCAAHAYYARIQPLCRAVFWVVTPS